MAGGIQGHWTQTGKGSATSDGVIQTRCGLRPIGVVTVGLARAQRQEAVLEKGSLDWGQPGEAGRRVLTLLIPQGVPRTLGKGSMRSLPPGTEHLATKATVLPLCWEGCRMSPQKWPCWAGHAKHRAGTTHSSAPETWRSTSLDLGPGSSVQTPTIN